MALLLVGVVAGAGLAEGFLRARGISYNVVAPHPDPALRYTLKPGLKTKLGGIPHEYNSRGLRAKEAPDRAEPGMTRILVVGDSISYAEPTPIERAFPRRLEDALNRGTAAGRRFEVLNGGVSGYNACQEEGFYRNVGSTYHPDIVVWQYCLNDVDAAWDPFGSKNLGFVPLPMSWKRWLRENVMLWSFARVKMFQLKDWIGSRNADWQLDYARRIFDLYGPQGDAARAAAWRCLADAHDLIQRDGGQMLLVVFPFRMQLDEGTFGTAPQEDVGRRALSEQIAVLDLLPAFRENRGEELFLVPDFIHLTQEGHRVAGESIAREILRLTEP